MQLEDIYPSRKLYIALEEVDFVWDKRIIPTIQQRWGEGVSIWDIASEVGRDPDEVSLLIMDLAKKDELKPFGIDRKTKQA